MGIFSNYCGLGGSGPTKHAVDKLCKIHDEAYGKLQAKGINPYITWNQADAQFLAGLKRLQHGDEGLQEFIVHMVGSGWFKAKRLLLTAMGKEAHIPKENEKKRKADEEDINERAHIAQRSEHPDDIERESEENLPATAQATMRALPHGNEEHNMGDAPEEGGEQQITKPTHVWRRFPNTETACLKWVQTTFTSGGSYPPNMPFDNSNYHTATSMLNTSAPLGGGAIDSLKKNNILNTTTGTDYNQPQLFQLRMTSPYNILKSYTTLNNNIGNSQPTWLELFDSKYQYYHVMETEWEVTFHFGKPNNGTTTQTNYQDHGLYIFWRYTNEDDPPVQWTANTNNIAQASNATFTTDNGETIATNEMSNSIGGGTVNLTADDYFRMGGWHHKRVQFNTTKPAVYTLHGKYKFGQCKMDIKTISSSDAHSSATTAEGWGQVGATPAFPAIFIAW